MKQEFDKITVADLREVCKRFFRLSTHDSVSKVNLMRAFDRQPDIIKDKVRKEVSCLVTSGRTRYARKSRQEKQEARLRDERPSKRMRKDYGDIENTHPDDNIYMDSGNFESSDGGREAGNPEGVHSSSDGSFPSDTETTTCGPSFMIPPDENLINTLVADFINATGNDSLSRCVCCVCARELPSHTCSKVALSDLPHRQRLKPSVPHPAHDVVDGLLLCPEGLLSDRLRGYACIECMTHLHQNKLPPFSLANNMWIGKTPYELSNLTLPERLMISKGFPSAYIVKLYPKQKGAMNWDKSQFHHGLRGNVSTYKMNPAQLNEVICDNIYPHPAKILSAIISVTFVGPKGFREASMPDTFRVRRWRVRDALQWLKGNNPLYNDIVISEARLADLPEDGIPEEIMLTTKVSTNTAALEKEHDGYVPEYPQENTGKRVTKLFPFDHNTDVNPITLGDY